MSSELVFVTGASGFLGAHVVHQLLEKGYRVRGSARGAKVGLAKQGFASYGDKFEAIDLNDVATDDITEHLVGVTAVIHTAAPLSNRGDPKVILTGAIDGSINIIRQAEKAGIKKIVYTSSITAVFGAASGTLTAEDWNPTTYEQALAPGAFVAYSGAKALAEKAVWKIVDEHKQLDVTVFNPPYFFGPFAPGFSIPTPDYLALSTTVHVYRLLSSTGVFPPMAGYIDVRDVARAHVAALTSPSESEVGRKRLLIASPHNLNYKEAVQFIAEKRPELRDRLVNAEKAPKFPLDRIPLDLERVRAVTGVTVGSYVSWQDTILDTVDNLLKLEKSWGSKGFTVSIPMPV